ncbi:four-carbon acid sugar kinase family protein [Paenarthrobacter sp. 2TAF44]|uniref:four-carbon acid sugar kinase family protein n=1 Tax=Paenarthrobacter sp. 2TAF44 TaxID=3233018 RepID=UPI003F9C2264
MIDFKIGVLADDLTSAGDGAGPFRALGISASIFLGTVEGDLRAGVSAVDVNTRSQDAGTAVFETVRCIRRIKDADVLFKTVDSTLRGHVVAEIEAALAESGRTTAVIAPAFPAEGRTTQSGVQLLDGVPVSDTHFGLDAANPATESNLKKLFPQANLINASTSWNHRIGKERILIADAHSDADLDLLVGHPDSLADVLWVGSPGLAAALAKRCAASSPVVPVPATTPSARVLIVVGSLHPSSREQLDVVLGLTSSAGQRSTTAKTGSNAGVVERVMTELSANGYSALHDPFVSHTTAEADDWLASTVQELFAADAFDALILTGGQTARSVLDRLGSREIDVLSEPEPGITLGILDHPAHVPVLIKAGGFGNPRTLIRLKNLLLELQDTEEES